METRAVGSPIGFWRLITSFLPGPAALVHLCFRIPLDLPEIVYHTESKTLLVHLPRAPDRESVQAYGRTDIAEHRFDWTPHTPSSFATCGLWWLPYGCILYTAPRLLQQFAMSLSSSTTLFLQGDLINTYVLSWTQEFGRAGLLPLPWFSSSSGHAPIF